MTQTQHIKFSHRVEYALLWTIQHLFTLLPIVITSKIFYGLIWCIFHTFWPLKRETVSRMREVFGQDLSIKRIREITTHSVWNLCMNYVELFHTKKMDVDYLRAHFENYDNIAETIQSLLKQHTGIIVALPHMGNWDLAGIACHSLNVPLLAIARAQNNPLVEQWLKRNRMDFTVIDRRATNSFKSIVHALKNHSIFAILPDIRHNKPGVGVTVFGKPDVQLGPGLSRFSQLANVPVLPFIMQRKDATHHVIRVYDPILPNLSANRDEDAQRITQAVWNICETEIRKNPEQWFWHNRRWLLTPLYHQSR